MNAKHTRPHQAPMITLGDIYFILFRHKWKIAVLAALGLVAALVLPAVWPRSYESEAKLLVKYVADTRIPTGPTSDSSRTLYPDAGGRNVINTELQIITSLDLAQVVATNATAAKILGHEGSFSAAAASIHANMRVENPDGSDVIRIIYKNRDPVVAQSVLTYMINAYLDRHQKIHQPGGADDVLTAEKDELGRSLKDTEASLAAIKTNLNIVSLDDSRKIFGDQMTKIQQDIFDAEAELADHQATYDELSKHGNGIGQPVAKAPEPSGTNAVAQSGTNSVESETNTVAQQAATNAVKTVDNTTVSPDVATEYKRVCDMLGAFRDQEKTLLVTFLPENSRVKAIHAQVVSMEKQKKQLEQDNPALTTVAVAMAPDTKSSDTSAPGPNRFLEESIRIAALQRRIQVLTNQLSYIHGRASALDANATEITRLERTRKVEEERYNYFLSTLLSSRIDANVGPGKASNINVIQSPSAPSMDNSKLNKARVGLAVAGILIGLGLAFLIELYIDHTVKRPADIETRLGVPLFLSIPYRNGNGNGDQRLLAAPPKTSLVLRTGTEDRKIVLNGSKTTIGSDVNSTVPLDDDSVSEHHCEISSRNGEVTVKDLGSATGTFLDGERIVEATLKADQTLRVGKVEFRVESQENTKAVAVPKKSTTVTPPWDPRHALRPFYDTLRDRLITYFEVKNLTHNPKLVALTSCGDRAGVTSTAAGLAAALSETGEGNVLLVDMNVERGAAHHFYKGHLSCGIDEALKKDKRHEARVQDNLYVVTESNSDVDSLPRVLPKRFTSLVPKLKASDYDYIIFDMPPMSQISITPRLARFMDMVMVVVESEKTDREVVQRAVNMLTEARANVGVVLNKRKNYVPKRIQQEL